MKDSLLSERERTNAAPCLFMQSLLHTACSWEAWLFSSMLESSMASDHYVLVKSVAPDHDMLVRSVATDQIMLERCVAAAGSMLG